MNPNAMARMRVGFGVAATGFPVDVLVDDSATRSLEVRLLVT
jgi:hypothetical protein